MRRVDGHVLAGSCRGHLAGTRAGPAAGRGGPAAGRRDATDMRRDVATSWRGALRRGRSGPRAEADCAPGEGEAQAPQPWLRRLCPPGRPFGFAAKGSGGGPRRASPAADALPQPFGPRPPRMSWFCGARPRDLSDPGGSAMEGAPGRKGLNRCAKRGRDPLSLIPAGPAAVRGLVSSRRQAPRAADVHPLWHAPRMAVSRVVV